MLENTARIKLAFQIYKKVTKILIWSENPPKVGEKGVA